ncbi:MAG: hypothetical protein V4733_05740 [Verrucomicrobiota bacterium]
MSLRIFFIGLAASFGIAWLAVVVVPFYKMRSLPPVTLNEADDGATGIFFPKRTGRIANGAKVYAENGCYHCHTQLVRPTYAGNDLFRTDWGGLKTDPDRGDTRRETTAYDYFGESFAQIGVTRAGPDLSNLGRRLTTYEPNRETRPKGHNEPIAAKDPEAWLYRHLYRPRSLSDDWNSTCPPHPFLFEVVDATGATPALAIPDEALFGDRDDDGKVLPEGKAMVPGPDARALVSYLLSLKKDQDVPKALDFNPEPKPEKKP